MVAAEFVCVFPNISTYMLALASLKLAKCLDAWKSVLLFVSWPRDSSRWMIAVVLSSTKFIAAILCQPARQPFGPRIKTQPVFAQTLFGNELRGKTRICRALAIDRRHVEFVDVEMAFGKAADIVAAITKQHASGTVMVEQLTYDPAHKSQPAWSPDGQRLAFTAWRYDAQIWRILP